MLVDDIITGKQIDLENVCSYDKVLVSYDRRGNAVFGYTRELYTSEIDKVVILNKQGRIVFDGKILLKNFKDRLIYSNSRGQYMISDTMNPLDIIKHTLSLGVGYPYSFSRHYEAIENFNIFSGKQKIVQEDVKCPLSTHLKYSFGLEFETSAGIVPESLCFRDGLIPLRDGSITGLEYSTVVLKGKEGLSLLSQQVETLRKHTIFNKECSLHIHFGGFPLDPEKIFNLYRVCVLLQGSSEFNELLPPWTFYTAKYKSSAKDYCKKLPLGFEKFDDMYRYFVGSPYYGDLTQPHPNDPGRNRKWNIQTRYFWVNFINIMCFKVNKTIEFRFLRPTYNYKKITVWLYILNAILQFAETSNTSTINELERLNDCLSYILRRVYPKDLVRKLDLERKKLSILVSSQVSNSNDKIGGDIAMEDRIFPKDDQII